MSTGSPDLIRERPPLLRGGFDDEHAATMSPGSPARWRGLGKPGWRSVRGVIACAALAMSLGLYFGGRGVAPSKVLQAAPIAPTSTNPAPEHDTDGDGLGNDLEAVLGLDPDHADTDGDGFIDSEELARGTRPESAFSHPGNMEGPDLGLVAWASGEGIGHRLHLVTLCYIPDGVLSDKDVHLGTVLGETPVFLPKSAIQGGAQVYIVGAKAPGELIVIVDHSLVADSVMRTDALCFFATMTQNTDTIAGDYTIIHTLDEVLVWEQNEPRGNALKGLKSTPQQQSYSGSSIFRPLTQTPPTGWKANHMCKFLTQTIGVVGGVMKQEKVQAECEPGWDTSCPPACPWQVGEEVPVHNPGVTVGG